MESRRVGYWLSEKKSKKFNLEDFHNCCQEAGLELVKIDLNHPLEEQGPFAAVIHKMTDVIAQANLGDAESQAVVERFERFTQSNPSVMIVDPLDSLRQLLDRYQTYSLISTSFISKEVFVPPFVDLVSNNVEENVRKLREAGVRYPFVCKHVLAHGSRIAHQMAIVFHEGAVQDCEPPCVAQTFVAHDALLFKIFVVGDKYFIVERPSLKNFEAAERPTIFFDSHDVSKPDSVSSLSILDEGECIGADGRPCFPPTLRSESVEQLVQLLRSALKMSLFGVDVVVEKSTGLYAIIDINAFPGYEGVPDFFTHVTQVLKQVVDQSGKPPVSSAPDGATADSKGTTDADQWAIDSGIDTGYSSDEKRHHEHRVRRSNPTS